MNWLGFQVSQGQSQGHVKVKYLCELLRRAEAKKSMLGCRSVILTYFTWP